MFVRGKILIAHEFNFRYYFYLKGPDNENIEMMLDIDDYGISYLNNEFLFSSKYSDIGTY